MLRGLDAATPTTLTVQQPAQSRTVFVSAAPNPAWMNRAGWVTVITVGTVPQAHRGSARTGRLVDMWKSVGDH